MNIFDFTNALKMAVQDELSRKLSFGCVNFSSCGSHPDMTHEDFILSIKAISKGFEETNWNYISDFHDLRKRGLEIEKEMYRTTSGKNTYKGLIFLGIILAYGFVKSDKIDDISHFIREFSKPLISDYKINSKAIYYKNLGLNDVRVYPLTGFKEIFELSKIYYESNLNDLILTIYLIAKVDDTTTVNRSSVKELRFLQKLAQKIYKDYNIGKNVLKQAESLNNYYLKNQITSGGVADIFTLTKTLLYLRRKYE